MPTKPKHPPPPKPNQTKPQNPPSYGREPGLVLLILLIGVAYSVAAPLMTPFALAYMASAWLVWRYQV
jgi:hypothetical protein